MHAQQLTILLALSGAMAAPAIMKRDCQDDYNVCLAQGTPEVACQCTLAACAGEDNARNREFCATATASSALAQSTAFTGICNAAAIARGDCAAPTASSAAPATTTNACVSTCMSEYNSCRVGSNGQSGNQAACLASYSSCLGFLPTNSAGQLTTPTACVRAAATAAPTTTITAAPVPTSTSTVAQGSGWTVENLIRYCSADGSGCDYNFRINTNDGVPVSQCTISRTNVANAPTESFYDVPCTTDSAFSISWGYSAQFGENSAFAVLTAVNNQQKAKAYFGVSNVNGGEVTASSPFGSKNFGNVGPETVYLF